MADHLIADISDIDSEQNEYRNAIGSFDLLDCEYALSYAADVVEENAKLRARLKAVVKIVESRKQWFSCRSCIREFLHVARGESDSDNSSSYTDDVLNS